MSDANKTTLKRFMDEVFQKGNLDVVDEIVAEDMVDRSPMPGTPGGREGVKAISRMFRGAFPDLAITVDDLIAEGDKVVIRVTTTGTQTGEFMGIAPTGRPITIAEQHIVRFANGKMVEHWGIEDNLGMLTQLGVVKFPYRRCRGAL